jgi:hypothetical protein
MMTPDNQAGRYTEEVMAKVTELLPILGEKTAPGALTTFQYNRIYEAVYAWLSEFEFPEAPE